jgi:hypothetical protein
MVRNNGIYNVASPDRYKLLKEFAKENKKFPTEAESLLWQHIKANKLWSSSIGSISLMIISSILSV